MESDKIIDPIGYVEKLDRFTKLTYTHHSRHNSKHHHQQSFGSRVDLTTCLSSVFDAEFEKKNEAENFVHFGKDVFFEENDILRIFHIFRPEGSIYQG
jgi:hypothetical protein